MKHPSYCKCRNCRNRVKHTADYKLQKRLAAEDSQRDAHGVVYGHKDLILGASMEEIDRAVSKIASVLLELRMAKIDAEIAKRTALAALPATDDLRELY